MRLEALELLKVRLELRAPVGTADGVHLARPVAFVRVITDEGEGWGECAALVDGTAVDPPLDAAWFALAGSHGVGTRLLAAAAHRGGQLASASQVSSLCSGSAAERTACAALEMAVLDAELKVAGQTLADRIGVARRTVEAGAVVGIPADRSLDTLLFQVADAVGRGFRRVRVKIAPGWDLEPLAAIRAQHPTLALQADANGAYLLDASGPEGSEALSALDGLGLACIEQPLPPADLAALAILAARLETPVALDESLSSTRRVTEALRYGACGVACLKPARLGGIFSARRSVELCAEAGVPAFVGGFFETGLARTANAVVAGLPGFTLAGDLATSDEYLDVDPAPGARCDHGIVTLPDRPGIGAVPDPQVLNARTVAEVTWRVPGR